MIFGAVALDRVFWKSEIICPAQIILMPQKARKPWKTLFYAVFDDFLF